MRYSEENATTSARTYYSAKTSERSENMRTNKSTHALSHSHSSPAMPKVVPFGDDDLVSVYFPLHQPSVVVEICSSCDA